MKKCFGVDLKNKDYKKLQEHYSFMFKNVTQTYNGYITSGVISKKYWITLKDGKECEICKENETIGPIGLKEKFPSGHLYPPASVYCRCDLGGVTKTDEKLAAEDGDLPINTNYYIKTSIQSDNIKLTIKKKNILERIFKK